MQKTIQDKLLEKVLTNFTTRAEAVKSLSMLLGVGQDAIYRRLRGDTLLTPVEISILAKKFHISIDSFIFEETSTVFCTFNSFQKEIKDVRTYLESIHSIMSSVKDLRDTKLVYATSDIPLFVYFFNKKILQFKFYIWGRTIWNLDYLDNIPFDFNIIPIPTLQLADDMSRYYSNLPSTELWTTSIFDNTLQQILYHAKSGSFTNIEDALALCDEMKNLTDHLQNMAKHGKKFLPGSSPDSAVGSFDLYHNEMVYTNNTILFDTVKGKAIFSSYTNPNFLKINDQRLSDFTEDWMGKIKARSIKISELGEKHRHWYFNRLKKKIEIVKNKISIQEDII